jgi:hypothetical protein
MVYEFADPNTVHIGRPQREALRDALVPPPPWYVGIARYAGNSLGIAHMAIARDVPGRKLSEVPEEDRWQVTTFTLGPVVFHAVGFNSAEMQHGFIPEPLQYAAVHGLRSLWPVQGEPPFVGMQARSDEQVAALHEHFGTHQTVASPRLIDAWARKGR